MNNIIRVHYDFTDGSELSYIEGKNCKGAFTTNCLEFFSTSNPNTFIVKRDGGRMSVQDLLRNDGFITKKEIREAHDLRKMLVAGAFEW